MAKVAKHDNEFGQDQGRVDLMQQQTMWPRLKSGWPYAAVNLRLRYCLVCTFCNYGQNSAMTRM